MGRVMAFMVLAANGLTPLSFAISGLVAETGIVPLFLCGGSAVLAAWVASWGQAFLTATWGQQPFSVA